MDRLRHLIGVATLLAVVACDDPAPSGEAPKRFAAVKKEAARAAAVKFCEQTFDAGARKWSTPPEQPLPGPVKADANPSGKAWTWVNLWASWCGPCVEELPLLSNWKAALQKEGVPLKVELWSIDSEADAMKGALAERPYPGAVHWLRSEEDLPGLLGSLGLPEDAAIPVHGLVDPSGHLRCVRVGKVGAANYPSIKTIVSELM
ncbi:MAG: hypothetical protein KC933_34340 [Myxococcales bacterium]|nr:hypothetical protein [Myxococcales bacterium]MCB9651544.1 hypothetical protein [Deltaproteobacteria bacterium]